MKDKNISILGMTLFIILLLFGTSITPYVTSTYVEGMKEKKFVTEEQRNQPKNDVLPPTITINFAGNPSDSGGPLHQRGDFYHVLPQGYYTNDSRQHENWIYINVSVNGTDSDPDIVELHWCRRNGQEITWNNNTWMFIQTGLTGRPHEFFYEFNSSGNITLPGDGSWYSFDVWASDTAGYSALKQWEKNGLRFSVTRRYVQLACTPKNITYTPWYVWDDTSESGVYGFGDYGSSDDLHHDQGAAFNDNDTGYLNSTLLGDDLQFRRCGAFVGLWFEDSVCTQPLTLHNLYFHFWWSTWDGVLEELGWKKNRDRPDTTFDDYYTTDVSESRCDMYVDNHDNAYNDTYHLTTHLLEITNAQDYNFTDNDIYEFCVLIVASNHGTQDFPNVIANRSIPSFVLFNVPVNETLNTTDWTSQGGKPGDRDGDDLSDWYELYHSYTSPFLIDTDNDSVSDYQEIVVDDTDPNNYSDHLDFQVDPDRSFVNLTAENCKGLTTCPAGDGYQYSNVKVTVRNSYDAPLFGIPAENFRFTVSNESATWYNTLSCSFFPVTLSTNETGEIQFSIIGDTSIVGNISINVTVLEIPLYDVDILSCKSMDFDTNGAVSGTDFILFGQDWNHVSWRSDFTWDGLVNGLDFVTFAQHWSHHL